MHYSTRAQIAALSETNPDLSHFIAKHDLTTSASIETFFSTLPPPNMKLEQGETITVPLRDGTTSIIRLFRPSIASNLPKPLVVLIHGGGFIMGDNTQLGSAPRTLTKLYSCIAVNIAYRLAPMHKFPTAAYDIHDILQWLSRNASSLGADLSKGFILFGASAGANLAAVTAQKWVSTNSSPPITGISLAVPWLLSEEIVPKEYKDFWFSRDQNEEAMILNKGAMAYMMAAYQPDVHSTDFSPFNDTCAHRGLPPVHIQVCGSDPLRDDGLLYGRLLRDHGIKTRVEVYPGVPHGFSLFRGLALAKRSFFDEILAIGWLLGDEKTDQDVEEVIPGGDYFLI